MDLFSLVALVLLLSALPGLYRLFIGPSVTDRVIGLDYLFALAVLFCLLSAWVTANSIYLDVAIGIALTGFIATLSWTRLIQTHSEEKLK